ncbi:MAG: hypothetical protein NTX50_22650, partial [Candidatus Sumerlaeota bacterium]|nr:hypothetical protein [Candidatus Sumerlaeota bacterium]
PKGLKGDQIPLESRILMIADLYEALSARDRPYKKPMSEEQLLKILQSSADAGEIDPEILRFLTEDKIHHAFEEEYQHSHNRTNGGSLEVKR